MPAESPLLFLRKLENERRLPPVFLISGPQAFLREYVLDALRDRLGREVGEYRGLQVGAGASFSALLDELMEPGLFSTRKVVACRVLRSHRARAEDAGGDGDDSGSAADAAALAETIEHPRWLGYLVLIYEGTPPGKLKRAVEGQGLSINCTRPFDDQLAQYARLFVQRLGFRLTPAAADLLLSRYGTDLAAVNNALDKAAITSERGTTVDADALQEPGSLRMPVLFELAESLTRVESVHSFAVLDGSLAVGRDPFELLAVEILPSLRRMLTAASLLEKKRSSNADLARALGTQPSSPLVTRAREGAQRYGIEPLKRAYAMASELDAGFKMGQRRGREQALGGLLLELFTARAN